MTDNEFVESLEREASVMVPKSRYQELIQDSEKLHMLRKIFNDCAKFQIPDRACNILWEPQYKEASHD